MVRENTSIGWVTSTQYAPNISTAHCNVQWQCGNSVEDSEYMGDIAREFVLCCQYGQHSAWCTVNSQPTGIE